MIGEKPTYEQLQEFNYQLTEEQQILFASIVENFNELCEEPDGTQESTVGRCLKSIIENY